jgi:hypothetical protein
MKLLSPGRAEDVGSTGRTRRAWRLGALLASGLLVAAFFVACGPAGQSTSSAASPQATNGATAQMSASGPESVSPLTSTSATSATSEGGTAQPSGVAAGPTTPVQSDLSNLDQLLNGMDDSLNQAGPSASGE